MIDSSVPAAFLAGLLSFFNPCVLPLTPGLLSYLAGVSLGEAERYRFKIFLNALFFVLGFSVVFALLGLLLNAFLKNASYAARQALAGIGGAVIALFGLQVLGVLRLGFLEKEHRLALRWGRRPTPSLSFIFGAAFAVSWTPCAGAVLGGIMALAVARPALSFLLLFSYAVGLGAPFLLVSLFCAPFARWIGRHAGMLAFVKTATGVLLVALGGYVLWGSFRFSSTAQKIPASANVSSPAAAGRDTFTDARIAAKEKLFGRARELSILDGAVNSGPFRLADILGKKVVLLEFWRFGCPNCQAMLPYLKAWHKKYGPEAFEVIGIHSPETEGERAYDAVAAFVQSHDIPYRVFLDNSHENLRRYGVLYWPTTCLIDTDGFVVWRHIGDGDYEEMEEKIQELLEERRKGLAHFLNTR